MSDTSWQAGDNLKDLGWSNGWTYSDDWEKNYPDEVLKCKQLGHETTTTDEAKIKMRGLDNVVRCLICGYKYHYDSSD